MRFELRQGSTRISIVIGNYVFKIPNVMSHEGFLKGLLNNKIEGTYGKLSHMGCPGFEYLAPVIFSTWGGWLNIMPYVEVAKSINERNNLFQRWVTQLGKLDHTTRLMYTNIVEQKFDSIGVYEDRVVAVDYH